MDRINKEDIVNAIEVLESVSIDYKSNTSFWIFCKLCGTIHVFNKKTKRACIDDIINRMSK